SSIRFPLSVPPPLLPRAIVLNSHLSTFSPIGYPPRMLAELPIWEKPRTSHAPQPKPRTSRRDRVDQLLADSGWLTAQSNRLANYFTGTTIKHLTGTNLAKIPFPPLFHAGTT